MREGDAEEQELFERLEREFAHVRVPRTRMREPRDPRRPRMPKTRRMLAWALVVGLGLWALQGTDTGRSLLAPVVGWVQGPVGTGPGEFAFVQETSVGPVRWSSCAPIEVVVNDALAPSGAEDLVERGIAEVAAASGLTISVVGRTDEEPSRKRSAEQPRYGAGWAPVLIAWTTPELDPGLEGDVVGLGGGAALTDQSGVGRYVSGQITLDAPQVERILARPFGAQEALATVMHEMGHVLGLGHVESQGELMAERGGVSYLGPGDKAGLAAAGSGPCL